jgi:hypothetical protein
MIERGAVGDDADRRAQGVIQVSAFDRDHGIAPRQRHAGKIAEEVRQPRQLRAGLVDRAAVVERLELVELVEIGLERIGKLVDEAGSGANVHAAPGLALEGRARALHGAVDIVSGGVRDLRDHLAGRRVAHVEHRAVAGFDLAAVDEIAMNFDGG